MIAEKYIKKDKLGEGTYGKVSKAINKETNQEVAIKIVPIDFEINGIPANTARELAILSAIEHPNVIKLLEYEMDESKVQLVLEFMTFDLSKYVYSKSSLMPPQLVQSYAFQLLSGLSYLHANGIIHRDISMSNTLLDRNGILKISDYGSARFFTIPIVPCTLMLTWSFYKSPEMLLNIQPYTPAIDVWGAGCVIAEMVMRRPLFAGDCNIDQLMKIFDIMGTPSLEEWPDFNEELREEMNLREKPARDLGEMMPNCDHLLLDLLKQMLEYNPSKRITARQALTHPYFDTIHPGLHDLCFPVFD